MEAVKQTLIPSAAHWTTSAAHGGAQWLSGRVLDSRPGAVGWSLTGVTALCP